MSPVLLQYSSATPPHWREIYCISQSFISQGVFSLFVGIINCLNQKKYSLLGDWDGVWVEWFSNMKTAVRVCCCKSEGLKSLPFVWKEMMKSRSLLKLGSFYWNGTACVFLRMFSGRIPLYIVQLLEYFVPKRPSLQICVGVSVFRGLKCDTLLTCDIHLHRLVPYSLF